MTSGRLSVMYARWPRFSYLMNLSSIACLSLLAGPVADGLWLPVRFALQANVLTFLIAEQFEKGVDTLHELTANLRASALDQVHGDPARAAVVEPHLRVLDGRHVVLGEDPHPIDQRCAIRCPLDQP